MLFKEKNCHVSQEFTIEIILSMWGGAARKLLSVGNPTFGLSNSGGGVTRLLERITIKVDFVRPISAKGGVIG